MDDPEMCTRTRGNRLEEEERIRFIINGKTHLVDGLFEPYERRARAIARRFLLGDESRIEDVIQEATMKAYMNLRSLRNKARFGSWFLTIVRNSAIDAVKRENLYIDKPSTSPDWDFDSWIANQQSKSMEPVERVNLSDMVERIKNELSSLDRSYGEPIRMRYIEDRSYNEIADILGKPLGTVKSLIHRGKAMLRERIYEEATASA